MAQSKPRRQLVELDPYKINVSEYNERTEDLLLGHLEESVQQQGVIQPVIVRERDMSADVPYEVVIGQRRVMAAQGADIDSVPAVVVDWDDAKALEKSISENIDTFREEVGDKDRAKAIERLKDLNEWDNTDVADSLGVTKQTVGEWLEWFDSQWEGTKVHPESDIEGGKRALTDVDSKSVKQVRQMTGGGAEGEEVVETVQERGLSERDVREAKKMTERGEEPSEAIEKVAQEKQQREESGSIKVRSEVTFTGPKAEAVQRIAEDHGTTENRIVEQAVETYLDAEGYL